MQVLLGASPNFRDLGGLAAADGRRVRKGLLYRSGALDELDESDLAILRGLSIEVCFDLRSENEHRKHPSRWPQDRVPRTFAIEVATDIRALDRDSAQYLIDHPDAEGAAQLMRAIYRNMPGSCAPVLQALVPELVKLRAPRAAVIHCTAGKDRTGFVVALLLGALGVAWSDIEADYLETNHRYDATRQDAKIARLLQDMFGVLLDTEALRGITAARLDYLAAAFDHIRRTWGGVERYLEECIGLDPRQLAALRDALLE